MIYAFLGPLIKVKSLLLLLIKPCLGPYTPVIDQFQNNFTQVICIVLLCLDMCFKVLVSMSRSDLLLKGGLVIALTATYMFIQLLMIVLFDSFEHV